LRGLLFEEEETMPDFYFGHELYIASMIMFALVAINLILLFFVPLARRTFGYTLLLFGIVMVLNMVRYQYQLALFGTQAEGKVVNLIPIVDTSITEDDRNAPQTTTYHPVVDFATADGHPVEFRAAQTVNEGVYSVGQKVNVRYMPANPGFAEVDSWLSLWRPMLLGSLFDWGVCGVGLILILRFGLPRRRAQ
jgi:hypothetical protein